MKVTKSATERGIGKVTGAALVGDNHLMTSHHFTTVFEIRNLSGELLASPNIVMAENAELSGWNYVEVDGFVKHNWGDMASVQTFDNDFTIAARSIPEDVSQGYFPLREDADLAEVKLYRPGSVVLNAYEVDEDNPEVSKEARRNSSNSDIADLRVKPYKFTSLGKENGYMVLKFDQPVAVNDRTRLQVVETSWNKLPTYENTSDAYKAYPEQASVYVSNYPSRYVGDWVNDEANWTKVGDAFISSNVFELDGVESFQWVKIVDDNSRTPDGYDVNYVATYEINPYCAGSDICVNYTGSLDQNKPIRGTFINTVDVDGDLFFKIRVRNTTDSPADYEVRFESFKNSYSPVFGTVSAKSECFVLVPVVNSTDNPSFDLYANGSKADGRHTCSVRADNTVVSCD